MPVTQSLSYSWYDTPNIHLCTIRRFRRPGRRNRRAIDRSVALDRHGNPLQLALPTWTWNLVRRTGGLSPPSQAARARGLTPPPREGLFGLFNREASMPIDPAIRRTRRRRTGLAARSARQSRASLRPAAHRPIRRRAAARIRLRRSSHRRSAEAASSASSRAARAKAGAPSACAPTWTRCRSRRRPTCPIARRVPGRCTPAATTATPRCCSARRAISPPPATSPARRSSSSSRPKKAAAAPRR